MTAIDRSANYTLASCGFGSKEEESEKERARVELATATADIIKDGQHSVLSERPFLLYSSAAGSPASNLGASVGPDSYVCFAAHAQWLQLMHFWALHCVGD